MNKATLLLGIGIFLVIVVFVFLFIISFFSPTQPLPTPGSTTPTQIPQSFPTPSLIEELNRQTEADINVNNIQNDVLQKYPWYNDLPIQETNYFVYFDVPQKSFIALLYPQSSSSISQEEQVASFKTEIISQLQKLGVNTNVLPIEWQIKPE